MGGAGLSLADRHCRPGAPALGKEELAAMRDQLPDWLMRVEGRISKTFLFPDFRAALDFVNRVGAIAEREGRHPEIHLGWGRADVTMPAEGAGGLTGNDFILAAKVDRARFGP